MSDHRGNNLEEIQILNMGNQLSKSQIDRLGQRLNDDKITEDDLRLLDEYRRSFGRAYEFVVDSIRQKLDLKLTGRPAKSTSSIIEKLQRETIRLVQIQDIAGCRIVLPDINEQDKIIESIIALFPESRVVDRRNNPSHGYRAVHVVPIVYGKPIEIQIKTALQHLWSELSEKLSDIIDPAIKYGGGPQDVKKLLDEVTTIVSMLENFEKKGKAEEVKKIKTDLEKTLNKFISNFGK